MFCRNCGKKINGNERFCPYCGEQIYKKAPGNNKVQNAKQHTVPKQKNLGKFLKWIVIALVIAMAAIIILAFINMNKEAKETIDTGTETNSIKDVEDLLGISVQEAKKLGMEPPDEFEEDDYLTNENMSLFLFYSNGKMGMVSMGEACPYPFHGIYIGDNLDEACIKLEDDFEILISDPEEGTLIAVDSDRNMSIVMGNVSLDNSRIEKIDINLDADIEALKMELLSIYEAETIESIPEYEVETIPEENSQSGLFIGMSGQYQCGSNMESGVIDVYVQGTEINVAIGTHRMQGILGGTGGGLWGTINDSTTAVVSWNDCTFTMVWSDTGVFTIYRDGETGIPEVDNCTIDGVEYVNARFYQAS